MGVPARLQYSVLLQMAAAGSYKQDLPPKGGYAPINYKRIPARQVLNGPLIYAGLFGSMAYGYWQYKRGIKVVHKQEPGRRGEADGGCGRLGGWHLLRAQGVQDTERGRDAAHLPRRVLRAHFAAGGAETQERRAVAEDGLRTE